MMSFEFRLSSLTKQTPGGLSYQRKFMSFRGERHSSTPQLALFSASCTIHSTTVGNSVMLAQ